MRIANYRFLTGKYQGNKSLFTRVIEDKELYSAISSIVDQNGNVNINEDLILIGADNGYSFINVKKFINGYVIDDRGRLHKPEGLERKIPHFCDINTVYALDKTSPYSNMAIINSFSATGNRHHVNEDSHGVFIHPQDGNLKLLILADGVGGMVAGNKASSYVVEWLGNCFRNIDPKLLSNTRFIEDNIDAIISSCNRDMIRDLVERQGLKSASTLVCAFINENDTVIVNVGDSRACYTSFGHFYLATEDDSLNWPGWTHLTVESLERMRTSDTNNIITQCMGMEPVKPHITTIKNKEYQDLYLFSDGITDCISYTDMDRISRNIDKTTLFSYIANASFGVDTPGAKAKGSDDRTVVHYAKR